MLYSLFIVDLGIFEEIRSYVQEISPDLENIRLKMVWETIEMDLCF